MKIIDIWSKGEVASHVLALIKQGVARDCKHLLIEQKQLAAFYPKCTKDWASRVSSNNVILDEDAYSAPRSYDWPQCPSDCPHYAKSENIALTLSAEDDVPIQIEPNSPVPLTTIEEYGRKEAEVPNKITLPWLFRHVPASLWLAAGGLLIAAFIAGIKASNLSIVREAFSLK